MAHLTLSGLALLLLVAAVTRYVGQVVHPWSERQIDSIVARIVDGERTRAALAISYPGTSWDQHCADVHNLAGPAMPEHERAALDDTERDAFAGIVAVLPRRAEGSRS